MVMPTGIVSVLAVVILSNLEVNQVRDGLQDAAVSGKRWFAPLPGTGEALACSHLVPVLPDLQENVGEEWTLEN